MSALSSLAIAVHALAAVVWVGGMFFAYMVLRPSAAVLEPPGPAQLWSRVHARFFAWVWAAVIALPVTGYVLIFGAHGGFAGAGVHVHVMQAIGWVMIALFVHLWFAPYARFRRAAAAGDWPAAAGHMTAIRRIVATNLVLGLVTVAIGSSGRFWG